MPLFSRGSTAASSSSSVNVGPPTSEIYTTPREGITVTKKWNYDEEQLNKIEQLKEYTQTLLLPESDPYYPWEKRFLEDVGTHARFMRAAKWKLDDAKKRIKNTMEWRREFKPELIEPEDVAIEAETGKIVISGFDKDGRPIIYMRPRHENTETSPRQIRHLIYCLERGIDVMPEGQEQVCIVVDYKQATSNNTPSVSTGLQALNILQHHYVERLGRGLVVNMPWWINAFFSAIQPFMDPITRDKIRFNPKLLELIDADQLDREYGGDYNFVFDKDTYWPALTNFCCLTPDGKRIDKEGELFIPASGNGIKWALEQHEKSKAAGGAGAGVAAAAPVPSNGAAAPVPNGNGLAKGHVDGVANGNGAAAVPLNGNGNGVPAIANSTDVKGGDVTDGASSADEDEFHDATDDLPSILAKTSLNDAQPAPVQATY